MLLVALTVSACGHAGAAVQPNILLILADDMRADSIAALGTESLHTPHLDRLAARGLAFRNAYCLGGNVAAVCTPSRNMLLSGQSFFRWAGRAVAPGDPPNLPLSFKDAGYTTYHHGKRGNSAPAIQACFEVNKELADDDADRRSGEPGKRALDDAIAFLLEAHRALAEGGWLRLSTPNLDWVWTTHYRLEADPEAKVNNALMLNRAFHGWRHQFLWNREMLGEALAACGFEPVRWCRYGVSALPVFQEIERHETYIDEPDLPHVIIAEASKGAPQPERLERFRELVQRELLDHMAD